MSESNKWTAGPWEWDYEELDENNAIVWLVDDPNMRVCFLARCDAVETTHANARLIAAAPEMAAALEGILDDDDASTSLADQRSRWVARMDAARAALAKARGETQ